MSNIFKKWSPKKSVHKSTPAADKTNDENKSPPFSKTSSAPKNAPREDFEEGEGFELPPSFSGRRPDRNLSISRSGRHKMRRNVRTSVMTQELYSPDVAPNRSPNQHWGRESNVQSSIQSSAPTSSGSSYQYCRETRDSTTNNLSGSQRMTRAPTAV